MMRMIRMTMIVVLGMVIMIILKMVMLMKMMMMMMIMMMMMMMMMIVTKMMMVRMMIVTKMMMVRMMIIVMTIAMTMMIMITVMIMLIRMNKVLRTQDYSKRPLLLFPHPTENRGSLTQTSSVAAGHAHVLTYNYDSSSDEYVISSCDGNGVPCWDGHTSTLEE